MLKATSAIRDYFLEHDIKFDIDDREDCSIVCAKFAGKNIAHATTLFISKNNENSVAFRVYGIVRVPEEKRAAMLVQINALNGKYRYLKFILDSNNGDIDAEYDFPFSCDVGETAFETSLRAMQIIDEAYPVFMKELWT